MPNVQSLIPYRVLARKYRPTNFDDLIGQEVLVRTLSNAIASNRLAHAFLLTGIRGVGKTTTARIIARALNCVGADGQGAATVHPCGVCPNCRMIAEDRHVDIMEMDAASHTGVGDIREIIDSVRYLPTSARYKIYIIDEVHMLSNSAFNALLKTLEEPPPHVKFIFATTEARKIPVTILSRCQRFDLKRIDTHMLSAHLQRIAEKENVSVEDEALTLISVAAEGSVRDALSLFDQAIARGANDADKIVVTAANVRQMIGSADNSATFRLLQTILKGDAANALDLVRAQYQAGSDPLSMVQDCLDITHLVTRAKISKEALTDLTLSQHDRESAGALSEQLGMPALARLWQMLLKGISEVRMAPSPLAAVEMLLVRITYAAQLPTPAEVIRGSRDNAPAAVAAQPAAPSTGKPSLELVSAKPKVEIADFAAAVALFDQHREALLYTRLKQDTRLVSFAPGKIDLRLTADLPRDFAARVGECLARWSGQPWKITLSDAEGEPSLHVQETAHKQKQMQETASHPLVASVLEQFPGATITAVKT